MWKKIKAIFSAKPQSASKPLKTIKELDLLDDVWVKDKDGIIYKGWVFHINKHHLIVLVPLENKINLEFRFDITRPLTQTQIVQGNRILFLNEPCMSEKLSTFQSEKVL